jgi:hypothetical protein
VSYFQGLTIFASLFTNDFIEIHAMKNSLMAESVDSTAVAAALVVWIKQQQQVSLSKIMM